MLVPKLRLIHQERERNTLSPTSISHLNTEQKPVLVFHCASHGEFDMVVPLLTEDLRKKYFLVAAFFSPSGFKHAKTTKLVHHKVYVPWDTKGDMRAYLDALKPHTYVFVKYDFWLNLMTILGKRDINTVVVNGLVRQKAFYFKPLFSAWKRTMKSFDHWFVQDKESAQELNENGITRVTVTGDLRFERVFTGKLTAQPNTRLEQFTKDKTTIIYGSSWPEEEAFISSVLDAFSDACVVVAPHDVSENHIAEIAARNTEYNPIRFSESDGRTTSRLLILDTIGLLREAYQYADLAIIGGGYGRGLHNVLEPAVWNIPVLCGPETHKNPEAHELQAISGLQTVVNDSGVIQAIQAKLEPNNISGIQQNIERWFSKKKPSTHEVLDYFLAS